MSIIKKGLMYFKTEGLKYTMIKTIEKLFREIKKIPYILYEILFAGIVINRRKAEFKNKNVYIIIPGIDWNIPLYQRPHQIANELAKLDHSIVLFVSDQYKYDRYAVLKMMNKNLWLYSIRQTKRLDDLLSEANNKIVFMSWTRHADLLNTFQYDKLVYEYIDELTLFYYYNDAMEQTHRALMRKADLTVCTATELYHKASQFTDRLILSENAGDYEFFKNNRNCKVSEEIAGQLKNYSCVLGYYGCLAYWFDYELICEVAKKKKDWLFILVGYLFDNTSDILKEKSYPNIIHIPSQPYQKLPGFISAFDIQIIPFVINDITKSTSPVKLFEYMASHKPIITSKLPECMRYESVLTYDSADEFIELVNYAKSLNKEDRYFEKMEQEALENTWTARVNDILKQLNLEENEC